MSVTYRNAPLVELIAELRWGTEQQNDEQSLVVALPQSKDEETFMHFGAVMSAVGYGRFERVVPPGFPVPYGQVAFRCRPTDPKLQAPLFQLGYGVFSANALPPYKSWAEFAPIVRTGIEGLFEAYVRSGRAKPEIGVAVVRYIDAFRQDLTGGRDIRTFLHEVMGLQILLPDAISQMASDPASIKQVLQFVVPTTLGRLELKFGEGKRGNEDVILMDTGVQVQRNIGANADAAIAALTEGRQLIHDLFRSLTTPIHAAMQPIS